MVYAVQTQSGTYTGTYYNELKQEYVDHHALYGETLVPVKEVRQVYSAASDIDGPEDEAMPAPAVWEVVPFGLAEMQEIRLADLKESYDRAFAGAVALADPSPVSVALEAALWAQEDAEGLQFMRDKVEGEYRALAAAIAGCETVEDVGAVKIAFGV